VPFARPRRCLSGGKSLPSSDPARAGAKQIIDNIDKSKVFLIFSYFSIENFYLRFILEA
jgi:hypothetical protein